MACKSCDHTMTGLGQVENSLCYYWCPRCGTLKTEDLTPPHEPTIMLLTPEQVEWTVPAGWTRAMDVLRRLWKYSGRHMDTQLQPIAQAADNILRDCDPERKEKP